MEQLTVHLNITDTSYIGAARRKALSLANQIAFEEADLNRLALIVSELVSNLCKHANKNPELVLQIAQHSGIPSINIIAIDSGPGVGNISQCLQDGFSTTQTSGTGLGAVSRLADKFAFHSLPNKGTVVLAQIWGKNEGAKGQVQAETVRHPPGLAITPFDVGALCIPKPGQEICGDNWSFLQNKEQVLILVADGLGHGPEAAEASGLAIALFNQTTTKTPADIINVLNQRLRGTRGAVIAVAQIDKAQKQLRYAGLGNISSCIIANDKKNHLISHNGTAGIGHFSIKEFIYPWSTESILVMHSDGLSANWSLEQQPGIANKQSTLIASLLYRDYKRGYDDATIVVAKENNESPTEINSK